MIQQTLHFDISLSRQEEKYLDAAFERMVAEKDTGEVGYYLLPENQRALREEISAFMASHPLVRGGGLKHLVVMGIGGSSLGAKAVDALLCHLPRRNGVKLVFLENGDPINLTQSLKEVSCDSALFVMISKSGSTIETTSATKHVMDRFGLALGSEKLKHHFLVITDSGSPLDRFASSQGVTAFHLPHNVGGRFSVLSAVGLLPLALVGYDIDALLHGAKVQKDMFFSKQMHDVMKKAYFYAKYANEIRMNVLFSYCSAMRELNAWYVQLWGESLGKINAQGRRTGLTPIGLVGSVDQHSFLQLIVQGPTDKSVTFIKIRDFGNDLKVPSITIPNLEKTDYINGHPFSELINAQCDATAETLMERGVPVDVLGLKELSEASVGALIMYFELLTSCTGAMLGVNTYDQPGVEFGKQKLVEKFS